MPDQRGKLSPAEQGRILVEFDGKYATTAGDCPNCGWPSSWQINPQLLGAVRIGASGSAEAVRGDLVSVLVWCCACHAHYLVEMAPWQL